MFEQTRTKVVELRRGYVADGKAHRRIVLRVPMIEDEIRRDAALNEMRYSSSEIEQRAAESDALSMLALVKECIVSWEGIAEVKMIHLRSLTRSDASKLIAAFNALEHEDAAEADKLLKADLEGNENGKSPGSLP